MGNQFGLHSRLLLVSDYTDYINIIRLLNRDITQPKRFFYAGATTAVTAASIYVGGTVAASGIPMANTLSIMGSSLVNSTGMFFVTGGQTPISISFGVASYDFTNNTFGYLGKKGNKWYENLGYGLGALAKLSYRSGKGYCIYPECM